jgi:hypothetical protein
MKPRATTDASCLVGQAGLVSMATMRRRPAARGSGWASKAVIGIVVLAFSAVAIWAGVLGYRIFKGKPGAGECGNTLTLSWRW